MTAIDDALALAAMTAGDILIRRRRRLCLGRTVGNDDARDATREMPEAMCEGTQTRRNVMTTTNTTTNRGAMGDDDNTTIYDNAMQETAPTRWVRGCYDETRHDET